MKAVAEKAGRRRLRRAGAKTPEVVTGQQTSGSPLNPCSEKMALRKRCEQLDLAHVMLRWISVHAKAHYIVLPRITRFLDDR